MNNSLKINTFYNLLGSIIPTFVTILVVPLYLRTIGDARFGVLSLLWIIFGYFGLFDFGLSRATANRLAQLRDAEPAEQRSVFYTSLVANLSFGIGGGLLLYIFIIPIFSTVSTADNSLAHEVVAVAPWIVAMFPLGMLNGVFVGSMEAKERFLLINIQQAAGGLLMQVLPFLFVTVFGPSLKTAVIGTLLARSFSTAWACFSSVLDIGPIKRSDINVTLLAPLLKYGGWITLTNSISPLLVSIDQFLIAYKIGAQAVAFYAVPFGMVTKSLIIPNAISRSLFPRLSYKAVTGATDLTQDAILATGIVMCVICAPALTLTDFGLNAWLGADFANSASPVAKLLLVGIWINAVAIIPFSCLQARGRPDLVAKFHALEIVPFIAMLWACVTWFGLPGAALAWSIRVSFDAYLLLRFTTGSWRAFKVLWPYFTIIFAAYTTSIIFCHDPFILPVFALVYFSLSTWMLVKKYHQLISGLIRTASIAVKQFKNRNVPG